MMFKQDATAVIHVIKQEPSRVASSLKNDVPGPAEVKWSMETLKAEELPHLSDVRPFLSQHSFTDRK